MAADASKKALIFDIRRYTVHDGPGIRTTVFFKGCPLKCLWCQNPESIDIKPEIIFYEQKCIQCGRCQMTCPIPGRGFQIFKASCLRCGRCSDVCMTGARKLAGHCFSPDELYSTIIKDALFYKNSGGGVTLSGGEPLLQADFICDFAALCKRENIHIAIDTCGYAPWGNYKKILPYVDLFLYDVKVTDPSLHMQYTGKDNHLILDNLIRLANAKKDIIVRVPLIPSYTDTIGNICGIAKFIVENLNGRIQKVELLPYNILAGSKYSQSSIYTDGGYGDYQLEGVPPQEKQYLEQLVEVFQNAGIPVSLEQV
jgi:pyruvate formate lyase activating enzyme